ncbi:hypothetical protein ACP70R_043328 [Stipagrostis hirtigluma subsp. patula]
MAVGGQEAADERYRVVADYLKKLLSSREFETLVAIGI